MNEKLMAGYAAFITAEEYGNGFGGEAPGTITTVIVYISATFGGTISATLREHC